MKITSLRSLRAPLLVLGLALAAATPARAFHTVFHYEVDRFEADGNVFGPAGGAPDLVDDFGDGVLGPSWSILFGTAYEQNGVLVLTNPGTHYDPGYPLDLSNVWSSLAVHDGSGDFTLTSKWVPLPIGPNTVIHMTLFDSNDGLSTPWEAFGVDISNFNGDFVASQHLQRLENGVWLPPQTVSVPLSQASITGPIFFRMTFNDATNECTTSFSIDGGQTFQSPFAPTQIFVGTRHGQVILGADPAADGTPGTTTTTTTLPPPACAPISAGSVVFQERSQFSGDERFVITGKIAATGLPPYQPALEGTRVILESTPGIPVLHDTFVPSGTTGCGPKDGWRAKGSTSTYHNLTNTMPAMSCGANSAHGLRDVVFKDKRASKGTIEFKVQAKNATTPGPGGPMRITLLLGDGSTPGKCAKVTLPCVRKGRTFKCR